MDFKHILAERRSTRKFRDEAVPREVIDRLLKATFTAPSARNSRSTRIIAVTDSEKIARMAEMRDYGAAFMKNVPLALVVAGDTAASPIWRTNSAISATILQLACVDEGLASCWVHVEGRPRLQNEPDGESAEEYLRTLLPVPDDWGILCVIAAGYSDFRPAPLPEHDDAAAVVFVE